MKHYTEMTDFYRIYINIIYALKIRHDPGSKGAFLARHSHDQHVNHMNSPATFSYLNFPVKEPSRAWLTYRMPKVTCATRIMSARNSFYSFRKNIYNDSMSAKFWLFAFA